MPWWGWMIIGAVLLGAEVFVSTEFYLAILGVAALVVGLIGFSGLTAPEWAQWLTFAVLAIGLLVLFRKKLWHLIGPPSGDADDPLIGGIVVTTGSVGPGAEGGGELRGTVWKVKNVGDRAVGDGERAVVVAVEGILLHVRPQ